MLSHGHSLNDTLLTRVHAPALSLTGCDDKDDDMQPVYSIATIENFFQWLSKLFVNFF